MSPPGIVLLPGLMPGAPARRGWWEAVPAPFPRCMGTWPGARRTEVLPPCSLLELPSLPAGRTILRWA